MKELSIEEKAKLYDEAIKRLEDIKTGKCQKTFVFTEGLFDYIFPELREESEGIRKYLISFVELNSGVNLPPEDAEQILAWLEKQGQKPVIEMKSAEESLGTDSETYNKIVDECVYGEQKPESEEDTQYINDTLALLSFGCSTHSVGEVKEWLQSLNNRVQPKQEWSEEDETVLNNLIYALANDRIGNDRDEYVSWLKSIKDRVQPKQEWSEEDSRILYNVKAYIGYAAGQRGVKDELFKEANEWLNSLPIGFIYNKNYNENMVTLLVGELKQIANNNNAPEQYQAEINWLKSLKHQNTWKPSDDEMDALANALSLAKNCGEESSFDLRTLYEQLKKLRKE